MNQIRKAKNFSQKKENNQTNTQLHNPEKRNRNKTDRTGVGLTKLESTLTSSISDENQALLLVFFFFSFFLFLINFPSSAAEVAILEGESP